MLKVGFECGGLPCVALAVAAAEEPGEQLLLAGFGASLILPLAVDDLNNVFIHEHRSFSFPSLARPLARAACDR